MAKVLVSFDDTLLARIDEEARHQGLSRSAFLAQLAARELGAPVGPGRDPSVHEALRCLDRLFAENPSPGDITELVRRDRDSR